MEQAFGWGVFSLQGLGQIYIWIVKFFWVTAFIAVSSSLGFALLAAFLFRPKGDSLLKSRVSMFCVAFSITIIGFTAAHFSALSRETATGDIVPIFLTGFGGVLVYGLIQKKISSFELFSVALFTSLSLMFGFSSGSVLREFGLPQAATRAPVDPETEM